ncbi:MAG: hypothetical protein NUV91_04595 [Candidatus Omnitrophica bacterium]|nr:hypothetical protein [Candidatus Omnitrophota bacterium]
MWFRKSIILFLSGVVMIIFTVNAAYAALRVCDNQAPIGILPAEPPKIHRPILSEQETIHGTVNLPAIETLALADELNSDIPDLEWHYFVSVLVEKAVPDRGINEFLLRPSQVEGGQFRVEAGILLKRGDTVKALLKLVARKPGFQRTFCSNFSQPLIVGDFLILGEDPRNRFRQQQIPGRQDNGIPRPRR